MNRIKTELLQNEISIANIAQAEGNRDLAVTTLYQTVKLLAEGTEFEKDCRTLLELIDALWVATATWENSTPRRNRP